MKIVTDSSCDLPDDILAGYDIEVVPLKLYFEGDGTYEDGVTLSKQQFREKMYHSRDLPQTAGPDPQHFIDAFEKAVKEAGAAIYIGLSSQLSVTFQNGLIARDMMGTDKVTLLDSATASIGVGVLAMRAAELVKQKVDTDVVIKKINACRDSMVTLCTFDRLENLVKSGRANKAQELLGNLLDVKLIVHSDNGQIKMLEKVRGRHRSLDRMATLLGQLAKFSLKDCMIGISHLDCVQDAEYLRQRVEQMYQPVKTLLTDMGASMGTHGGRGAIVIAACP
ncbi:MAG: DegV family protein [Candidatus Saccharibacteria bacterium]